MNENFNLLFMPKKGHLNDIKRTVASTIKSVRIFWQLLVSLFFLLASFFPVNSVKPCHEPIYLNIFFKQTLCKFTQDTYLLWQAYVARIFPSAGSETWETRLLSQNQRRMRCS